MPPGHRRHHGGRDVPRTQPERVADARVPARPARVGPLAGRRTIRRPDVAPVRRSTSAWVAQPVEQRTRNAQVRSSILLPGSRSEAIMALRWSPSACTHTPYRSGTRGSRGDRREQAARAEVASQFSPNTSSRPLAAAVWAKARTKWRLSVRSQFYRGARDLGNLEAAEKGPGSRTHDGWIVSAVGAPDLSLLATRPPPAAPPGHLDPLQAAHRIQSPWLRPRGFRGRKKSSLAMAPTG